ncbi:thiolase family protein [Cryptosporangium phraense]|uniref:acetyl-CoA C-acyltransferase n=1 Tax=Cryptosporangium phraense TaxID=2593070 RepID=A0A545B062_9ACTN|nr:thiolase family protein [Cryptosporangium phraense]TQS46961.1 thiolase family protein [Cryptosporangium phraense]
MAQPVIVSAARTAIGTARKGTLAQTPAEDLATAILTETVRRSGIDPARVDDVIFAESLYGGGDLARYAAVVAGMTDVPGIAVNRHCTGSLSSIGLAAAGVASGMEKVVVAGGVNSSSLSPRLSRRVPGTVDQVEPWYPGTHPNTPDAPNTDMSITVGWNSAQEFGITREEMDAWALRSHQRAIAAIDAGKFAEEIVPIKVSTLDGSVVEFAVDEHPRRDTSAEKLASLKVLHPEIEGFSITAGNASGVNDAAAAVTVAGSDQGLEALATIRAWVSVGVEPARTGVGAVRAIEKVLDRAGLSTDDVKLWEINEAFASVPVAACKHFRLDEERVNFFGSGCSLGHPIAASGARMVNTLIYELRRTGGGIGVAAMCAGGGQGGALVLEV